VIQKFIGHIPSHLSDYIVHSDRTQEVMKPYLPETARIHKIPIYCEAVREPTATPEKNVPFVYIGRLVREKGVAMLARVAAKSQIPLLFIGSGPLEAEIRRINPGALITGWLDSSSTTRLLRDARALVFPSLWYETLGLVVLEAAANGIPSIVPDISAATEIVGDGVTGLHFRSGDEDDLRVKLNALQKSELAASLGRAAYERFWSGDECSRERHIDLLEKIYEGMLRRSLRSVSDLHTSRVVVPEGEM
jgi:glycosyltransferase involved in cell wall biosynthesis